jgi:hypothetical protein
MPHLDAQLHVKFCYTLCIACYLSPIVNSQLHLNLIACAGWHRRYVQLCRIIWRRIKGAVATGALSCATAAQIAETIFPCAIGADDVSSGCKRHRERDLHAACAREKHCRAKCISAQHAELQEFRNMLRDAQELCEPGLMLDPNFQTPASQMPTDVTLSFVTLPGSSGPVRFPWIPPSRIVREVKGHLQPPANYWQEILKDFPLHPGDAQTLNGKIGFALHGDQGLPVILVLQISGHSKIEKGALTTRCFQQSHLICNTCFKMVSICQFKFQYFAHMDINNKLALLSLMAGLGAGKVKYMILNIQADAVLIGQPKKRFPICTIPASMYLLENGVKSLFDVPVM